jgi:2-phosphosulfolactate phosphatase
LRPCLEDYLGAGAILACLGDDRSPEAEVCGGAFAGGEARLAALIWECASGRELRARGKGADVRLCAERDRYAVAPLLRYGCLVDGAAE